MRFRDQVAVVTGAGRGIGQAIAASLAAEAASVVVADIDGAAARSVADRIVATGGRAIAIQADVAEQAQVHSLIGDTLAKFGRIDVLVNNAGIGSNKPFLETTLEEWELQLRVNLTGTFLCGQAAAKAMSKNAGGRIVNVASISGQRGGQGRAAYGASKAGVILLTKVMAVELAPLGIRVNAVSPGPVDTDQSRGTHTPSTRRAYYDRIPVRRYGEREEIAAAVLFLAARESSFVTGHVLNVDGGFNAAGLVFDQNDDAEAAAPAARGPAVQSAAHCGGNGRVTKSVAPTK
jgi:NAD(P)-dependent dehydrogenase (short-subunit alcohol dehydrogenase family)